MPDASKKTKQPSDYDTWFENVVMADLKEAETSENLTDLEDVMVAVSGDLAARVKHFCEANWGSDTSKYCALRI